MPAILAERNTTHGHGRPYAKSPTYVTWQNMKARCYNPNRTFYEYYGGAGVTVCKRWRDSFENFLADMGERPPGTTLDRYPKKNGNYTPSNCRWATKKDQQNNMRLRRTYKGKAIKR